MICIVDYHLGNFKSVLKAFEKIGHKVIVSSKKEDIKNASKLVLPGVGSFKQGMKNLKKLALDEVLKECVLQEKKPILGICLGMQLFASKGYEGGECNGLGFVHANVLKFDLSKEKLLHSGWDDLRFGSNKSRLFDGILEKSDFYFVHSYYVECLENIETSFCEYEKPFCASFEKENIFAVQFHPEKSQSVGLKLLENFANLKA
ncbi:MULTISPECIES: imidazole glycerol phosphate synthase subunit HisH [unclassified Campylobacter]|uniref:imidazole glycerol phosphate synthase subunit HisH n=1 Tax=unclassified Campylobacter TaxID=2593542 RepID=UPI000EA91A36|nr:MULTISPECIES: imidazole glycerol phosphate synthase subunit HisH [unclassified Campylobacter]QOR00964.1 imidazole glycerol phosphate synthase subunit HisH [Campylobacter sp. 2014D-0216]RKO64056.1 imidazole glycerol phosphate synthase subunit HisH [Campylobacter sp. P255]